jgi:hypothetical protein
MSLFYIAYFINTVAKHRYSASLRFYLMIEYTIDLLQLNEVTHFVLATKLKIPSSIISCFNCNHLFVSINMRAGLAKS